MNRMSTLLKRSKPVWTTKFI